MNAEEVAKALIEIQAVQIRPDYGFTWTSGIKSPIYIDCRKIGSFVEPRKLIYGSLATQIKRCYPDAEAILGVSSGGVIPATMVSAKLGLAVGYIRSKAKAHGQKNQIEFSLPPKTKIVIVEDIVSTAQSLEASIRTAKTAGYSIIGTAAIFSYGLNRAKARLAQHELPLTTICNLSAIAKAYSNLHQLTAEASQTLHQQIADFIKKINT